MKRFFKSDRESDALIEKVTKLYGLKIGEFINMAIKNELYPVTDPFRTEAAFLLQSHTDGKLDAWVINVSWNPGAKFPPRQKRRAFAGLFRTLLF